MKFISEDSYHLVFPIITTGFIIALFSLDYNNNIPKLSLFDKDVINNTRHAVDINSIDDIHNYLKFLSKNRFIIEINRIYASKSNNISGKRHYGVILKMHCVECINNYRKIDEVVENNDNKVIDFLD